MKKIVSAITSSVSEKLSYFFKCNMKGLLTYLTHQCSYNMTYQIQTYTKQKEYLEVKLYIFFKIVSAITSSISAKIGCFVKYTTRGLFKDWPYPCMYKIIPWNKTIHRENKASNQNCPLFRKLCRPLHHQFQQKMDVLSNILPGVC